MTERPQEQPASNWALPFFSIWTGQAFSLLGSQLVQFALAWWLTLETGSATVLTTAAMVALLPNIFLGPFIGSLVDRWNRRRVMIAADSLVALAALGLVYLFWSGRMEVWHVYVVMLVRGIGGGFHWPAMTAATSLMVPKEHLPRIQGLNQTLQGGMNIIAPPLGALLMETMPLYGIVAIDVGTALLAILPLLFVAIPEPKRRRLAAETGFGGLWQDVRTGLRYIWSWPGLFALMVMAALINFLLNPAYYLLPLWVRDYFGGGAIHLGWLQSASGMGVVLGGLILSAWGGFRRRIWTTLFGLIGVGVGSLLLGLTPATMFWLAVALIFFRGAMGPIANGPLLAVVQGTVDPEIQGRVFTVMSSLSGGMAPLGLAIAGPVADRWGVQPWFILGGIVCILVGAGSFFVPAIVGLEEGRREDRAATAEQSKGVAAAQD